MEYGKLHLLLTQKIIYIGMNYKYTYNNDIKI